MAGLSQEGCQVNAKRFSSRELIWTWCYENNWDYGGDCSRMLSAALHCDKAAIKSKWATADATSHSWIFLKRRILIFILRIFKTLVIHPESHNRGLTQLFVGSPKNTFQFISFCFHWPGLYSIESIPIRSIPIRFITERFMALNKESWWFWWVFVGCSEWEENLPNARMPLASKSW